MKSLLSWMRLPLCLGVLTFVGCDSKPSVVEAPPETEVEEEIPAMEGMTDEEYNQEMEKDMGN